MKFNSKTHRQIISFNKEIGHLYTPNLKVRLMDDNGGYLIKTNSQGFRSNIEFKKEKEKKRILFFGDSNTAGDGVSNNDRFSDILGNHLDAEIYNFAVSGTGTDQQFLIKEKFAKDINADLIIIGILVENIERNKVSFRETINSFTKLRNLTSKPYFDIEKGELILKNHPVKLFAGDIKSIPKDLVQWSVPENQKFLYRTLKFIRKNPLFKVIDKHFGDKLNIIRSSFIKNFYQPYKDYAYPQSKGYLLQEKIINKFINSFKDIPVILFPIPTYHYYFDGSKPIYQDFYKSFANKSKKIFTIDPLNDILKLKYENKKKLSLKNDKSHFSNYGHSVLANILRDEIKKIRIFKDIDFKNKITKEKLPNDNYILGISAFYHDSAATLIKNGKILAAVQEERFTRKKNDKSFPVNSINYCLEEAFINPNELSAIVFYEDSYQTLERVLWSFSKTYPKSRESWLNYLPDWLNFKFQIPRLIRKKLDYKGKILHNNHHRSHLASAFFPSPFKRSAILTIDGVGEWATASIGVGQDKNIEMIKEMFFPNSVGLLYSAFTQFLGFKVNSGEYKMMGLAPYGQPKYTDLILKEIINLNEDGSIQLNQKYFDYISGSSMTSNKFSDLFNRPKRNSDERITQSDMDIACSIQKVTEKIVLQMARYAKKITNENNLCLSGGVALNCVANGELLKSKIFDEIWIQPASGDAGSSLGCALDCYHSYFNREREIINEGKCIQEGSMFGPSWSKEEIKSFLDTFNIDYEYYENNTSRNNLIAKKINEGEVVGFFSGRTEFGPRALGSRSIVADPRNKEMQSKLNLKIKYRESFRPFAPAVLMEKTSEYFNLDKSSPYMMLVSQVVKNKQLKIKSENKEDLIEILKQIRSDVPAITHVDYSARVQTIDKEYNQPFYELIKEFENQTGCPILINTSFNVRGEPIVNSPFDAYRCFVNTEMDLLVLGNFLIKNKNLKFLYKNMNISKKTSNRINLRYERKLKKIYRSFKDFKPNNTEIINGWLDLKKSNIKDIFEIPKSLDTNDFDYNQMKKDITKNWKDKNFAKKMNKILLNLLYISNKNIQEYDNSSGDLSDEIYEMF